MSAVSLSSSAGTAAAGVFGVLGVLGLVGSWAWYQRKALIPGNLESAPMGPNYDPSCFYVARLNTCSLLDSGGIIAQYQCQREP